MHPFRNGNTSIRDRTQEFSAIAERVKKSSALKNGPSTSGSKLEEQPRSTMAVQSEFKRRASKIGLEIHQTSQMLAKLAKLAKTTSVFNDPAVEIQELTAVIKQDITALNSAVVDLQFLQNSVSESGNTSIDTTSHANTVVVELKNRLMSTTEEFKDVLKTRKENMKLHESRIQKYSSSGSRDRTNPNNIRQRASVAKSATNTSATSPPPWSNQGESSSSQLFQNRESQPLLHQQQQQTGPLQNNYMQSRADALQNVESTIQELGNVFNHLATLVSQQGEIAIRIDENMEDTLGNVEGAQGALLKYLNSVSSNRWLMIKIFFVLIFFLTVFLFFVA